MVPTPNEQGISGAIVRNSANDLNRFAGIFRFGLMSSSVLVTLLGFRYGLSPDEALVGTVIALTVLVVSGRLLVAAAMRAPITHQAKPTAVAPQPPQAVIIGFASVLTFAVTSAWLAASSVVAIIGGGSNIAGALLALAGWALVAAVGLTVVFVACYFLWVAWRYRARIFGEFQDIWNLLNNVFQDNMRSRAAH